jgi:hypothetical protein
MTELKADMAGLKVDMAGLKTEVTDLKTETPAPGTRISPRRVL